MPRLILAAALFALAACNRNEQAAETTGVDQNVAVETIGGNDITAIDAATNDSANMAADVEANLEETLSNEGNTDEGNAAGTNAAGGNEQ